MRRSIVIIIILLGCFCIQGSAQGDIKKLKSGLLENKPDSERLRIYDRVILYYSERDNDSAIVYANEGLQYFKRMGYKRGQVKMLCRIGDFEDIHGNSKGAIDNYNEAQELAQASNDKLGMATAHNNLGAAYGKSGNSEKAIYHFIEASKIFETIGEKEGEFSAAINIATLYVTNSDSAKSLEWFKKAEKMSQNLPLSEMAIILNLNLGQFYADQGKKNMAMPYFRKAMNQSAAAQFITQRIGCMMSLGELYFKNGNLDSGKYYLYKALALTRENKLPDLESDLLINCASLIKDQNKDSCLSFLNQSLKLALQNNIKPAELKAYNALVDFYDTQKNYEEESRYLKLSRHLSDSLFNIEKAKQIAGIDAVYELKRSNDRINDLESKGKSNQIKRNIIIGIALLLLIFSTIIWYYLRKAKKLNQSLDHSRKQLVDLNAMKDKLFSIIAHDLRGPIGNIPPLIGIIESDMDLPVEFKEILESLKDHTNSTLETLDKLVLLGRSVIKGDKLNPVLFATKDHIKKNMELLSLAALKKNITIEDHTSDDIQIFADPSQFDFIIRNLISNALKFSYDKCAIEIHAESNQKTGFVTFSVKDCGVGMSEDVLSHLFKATVVSTYGTSNEKGTGIGLMLCEEFVTLNGGKIWAESKKGEGSTFYFTLKTK